MLALPLINPYVKEKVILCVALLASVAYVSSPVQWIINHFHRQEC